MISNVSVLGLGAMCASLAVAAPVVVTFQGAVTSHLNPLVGTPFGGATVGDSATLVVTMSNIVALLPGHPNHGLYSADFSFSLTIGSATDSSSPYTGAYLSIFNDTPSDFFHFDLLPGSGYSGSAGLYDADGSAIATTDIPSSLDIADWDDLGYGVFYGDFGGELQVTWDAVSLSDGTPVVPLPSGGVLAAAGLASVALVRRRR